jgi:NADPH-dependent glutamate synthase beta subunit-like oxidoreductase
MTPSLIPPEIREKAKYCFECGVCTASCPMAELLAMRYNPRTLLQAIFTDPEQALKNDNLWLCAWCYKFYHRCPQGLRPPEIFQLLKTEAAKRGLLNGFKTAVSRMAQEVPLPAICWYACFHPERAGVDDQELDRALREILAQHAPSQKGARRARSSEKVAIIGSGPAGLTAALELAKEGYVATIFEALPVLGGALRSAMPTYRLPRAVLDSEIQNLKNMGIVMHTNTRIGDDKGFDTLWDEGYQAVLVAVGAQQSRKLGIEGEDLEGVVDALELLWQANTEQQIDLGRRVAVVGGGNVAVDAARTAHRQGAEEVTILYRRTREEMPANPWEAREAEKEGINIEFLVTPKRILGKDSKATGIECIKMKLGELDETGRRKPVPIDDSEFSLEFDTIIVAIGEGVDTAFLPKEIALDRGNRILVNPITMETSMTSVFAGGDAVTGPATVMEAILAGKRAACSIHQYLQTLKEEEKNGDR